AIDYLWEGLLGRAVWGTDADEAESSVGVRGAEADLSGDVMTPKNGDGLHNPADNGMVAGGVEGHRQRSVSLIEISLLSPVVAVPGHTSTQEHVWLEPRSLVYRTWTGGERDKNSPPAVEVCSENGPEARHMLLDVHGICMFLDSGTTTPTGATLTPVRSSPVPSSLRSWAASPVPPVSPTSPSHREEHLSSELEREDDKEHEEVWEYFKKPVDLRLEVTRLFSTPPKVSEQGTGAPKVDAAGLKDRDLISAMEMEEGESIHAQATSEQSSGLGSRGATAARGDDQWNFPEVAKMHLRLMLQKISLRVDPRSLSALAGAVGGNNISAAGFHGHVSDTFPLPDPGPECKHRNVGYGAGGSEVEGRVRGMDADPATSSHSNAPTCSPTEMAYPGSRDKGGMLCASCGVVFGDVVASHHCWWCCDIFCRACLHTKVREEPVAVSNPNPKPVAVSGLRSASPEGFLVCDLCASWTFPSLSVSRRRSVHFCYGDDGPAMPLLLEMKLENLEVDLEIPRLEKGTGTQGVVCPLRIDICSLGLSLDRAASRRGALEISIEHMHLWDSTKGLAFPCVLAPASSRVLTSSADTNGSRDLGDKTGNIGGADTNMLVLSYHYTANGNSRVQVILNHLEVAVLPSTIRHLQDFFSTGGNGDEKGKNDLGSVKEHARSAQGSFWENSSMVEGRSLVDHSIAISGITRPNLHDLATLQQTKDRFSDEDTESAEMRTNPLAVKATLVHPLFIIMEDATDPNTSALFLQGLMMAHYVRSPRLGGDREGPAFDAQDTTLNVIRMESRLVYMREVQPLQPSIQSPEGPQMPSVKNTGLGAGARVVGSRTKEKACGVRVRVLDPVTCSLNFTTVERPLHPTAHTLICQVDDVACQLSFQDMYRLPDISQGWLRGFRSHLQPPTVSPSTAASPNSQFEASPEVLCSTSNRSIRCGDDFPNAHDPGVEKGTSEVGPCYDVVFSTQKLGLVLAKRDGLAMVEESSPHLESSGGPFVGDELIAVSGRSTQGLSYQNVIHLIVSNTRPLKLTFRRYLFISESGREYCLTFNNKNGEDLDGVLLKRGGAGDQAVVSSSVRYLPKRTPKRTPKTQQVVRPRPGAVVTSVNGVEVGHLPMEGVMKRIHEANLPLRVGFKELKACAWPPTQRAEVQFSSLTATVIDDREGRDMPLIRLEVGGLDIINESGSGVAPRLALPPRTGEEGLQSSHQQQHEAGISHRAAVLGMSNVLRTEGVCDAQLDYYNARAGRWEPMVERFVVHAGSELNEPCSSPFISTQGEQKRGTFKTVRFSCSEDLKVNVTHEVLDIVTQASRDWLKGGWRDPQTCTSLPPPLVVRKEGADEVAEGGLEESKDALGRSTGNLHSRYLPFVLQNRTGVAVEFWAHEDRIERLSHFKRRGTLVSGLADYPFSTHRAGLGQTGANSVRERPVKPWLVSLRLLQHRKNTLSGTALEGTTVSGEQHFLNLPLAETGCRLLQCVLDARGDLPQKGLSMQENSLERCETLFEAVWEVSLENGRHRLMLRSSLELVNHCGIWLETVCSTDSLHPNPNPGHAGCAEGEKLPVRMEEVVGKVPPGGRLPLPLRWSRAEDIRIRPIHPPYTHHTSQLQEVKGKATALRRPHFTTGTMEDGGDQEDAAVALPGESTNGVSRDSTGADFLAISDEYNYSDCSVIMPTVRAGGGDNARVLTALPWVSCTPKARPRLNQSKEQLEEGVEGATTALSISSIKQGLPRPLFFFLNAVDTASQSPTEGHSADVPTTQEDLYTRGRVLSMPSSYPRQILAAEAATGGLAVEVRACLSLRNLLPVGLGWRAFIVEGHELCSVGSGWLKAGERAHMLGANVMAQPPRISFQVQGFEWTQPQLLGDHNNYMGGRRMGRKDQHDREGRVSGDHRREGVGHEGVGHDGALHGLGLESIPCKNGADQIFCLNMEVTAEQGNSVRLTAFTGFWVRNISGLPLTLGEPVLPTTHSVDGGSSFASSSMSTLASGVDVVLAAVQGGPVVEEVFEVRIRVEPYHQGARERWMVRWCSESGNPRPPTQKVSLPSDCWQWADNWRVDRAGGVAPQSPGMDGGGWESCTPKER
ncbi:unnamed protein product, partial [Discosporangium mesarthrocarpum]